MKRISYLKLLIFSILLGLMSCESEVIEECLCAPPIEITFKTGTSYGFCAGYCFNELSVNDNLSTLFTKSSIYPGPEDYPTVQIDSIVSQTTYDSLLLALSNSDFFSLQDTLSDCLDCADGGAEWVEIIEGGSSKKVVFDAGAEVKEMEALLKLLRELKSTYE